MKHIPFYLVITLACLYLSVNSVTAQSSSSANSKIDSVSKVIEKIYGPDQLLVSGTYFENTYKKDLGFPYFLEDKFCNGYLIYKDKLYPDLQLKYNIYEQTVLLNYKTPNNQQLIFTPSNDFIAEFSVFDRVFKKFKIEESGEEFYQVVYSGEIKCLYYWYKQRDESYHEVKYLNYIFLDGKKKMYLLINNKLEHYKSKSGFKRSFPKAYRSDISDYMKSNKVKLKTSTDETVAGLVSYCDKLINAQSHSESENLDN